MTAIPSGFGVNVGPEVGIGGKVEVAVGGGDVVVGMAAWVSATSVKAAATAVLCRSVKLIVGVACDAPHALIINVIMSAWVKIKNRFKWRSPY